MASLITRSGLLDLWHKDADPFTSQLFMTQSPLTFMGVLAAIFFTIKRTEQLMKHEKQPEFVKPALLVLYGLNFGVNGAGILLALTATDAGRECFRCVNRNDIDLMSICMRYLGYAYVCTLVFEFWMQVLEALQQTQETTLKHLRSILWIMVNFTAFNFSPVGQFAFCPLAHCVIRTFEYALRVLASASPELRLDSAKWASRTHTIKVIGWTIISAQQLYVYSLLNCDYSWINLSASTAAALQAVSLALNM